jgi:hypothetical protein
MLTADDQAFIDAVDAHCFAQILQRVVSVRNNPADSDSPEFRRKLCLREGRTELRACYPADIRNILISMGRCETRSPWMTHAGASNAPPRSASPRAEPGGRRGASLSAAASRIRVIEGRLGPVPDGCRKP